jgi:hypothetical protein
MVERVLESRIDLTLVEERGLPVLKEWKVYKRTGGADWRECDEQKTIDKKSSARSMLALAALVIVAEHDSLLRSLGEPTPERFLVSKVKRYGEKQDKEPHPGERERERERVDTAVGKLYEAADRSVYLKTALAGTAKVVGTRGEEFPRVQLMGDCPRAIVTYEEQALTVAPGSPREAVQALVQKLARLAQLMALSAGGTFAPEPRTQLPLGLRIPCERALVSGDRIYSELTATLEAKGRGTLIRLMSTQPHDPRRQDDVAMLGWHEALHAFCANSENLGSEVRRLVALEYPEKWPWIEDVLREFKDLPVPLSMRVLPMLSDSAGRRCPLPRQIHILGDRAFLGGARRSLSVDEKSDLGEVDDSPLVVDNHTKHYDLLWRQAGSFPDASLLTKGRPQAEAIASIKAQLCVSFIRARAQEVTDQTSFLDLTAKMCDLERLVPDWWKGLSSIDESEVGAPYARRVLAETPRMEVMLATWSKDPCWPHCHGGAMGRVRVLQGKARTRPYFFDEDRKLLKEGPERAFDSGEVDPIDPSLIHAMRSVEDGLVTLHLYFRSESPGSRFRVFDLAQRRFCWKDGGGAYAPRPEAAVEWHSMSFSR